MIRGKDLIVFYFGFAIATLVFAIISKDQIERFDIWKYPTEKDSAEIWIVEDRLTVSYLNRCPAEEKAQWKHPDSCKYMIDGTRSMKSGFKSKEEAENFLAEYKKAH